MPFMTLEKNQPRALLSWIAVGLLVSLCGVLGVLQFRWIGEIGVAEHERLRRSLQTSLLRLSQDFNTEITAACAALLPSGPGEESEQDYTHRYAQWKAAGRHPDLFRRIARVAPQEGTLVFRSLDLQTGFFLPGEWPLAWNALRDRLAARLSDQPWEGRRPPGPFTGEDAALIDLPRFRPPEDASGPPRFGRREAEWLIVELDLDYVRSTLLPELLQRHLGSEGKLDYQAEVSTRSDPSTLLYQSNPDPAARMAGHEDASVGLFEVQYDRFMRRPGPAGMREGGPGGGPGPPMPGAPRGRWQLSVRHRAGSLEAVVSRARWRNLAVTTSILLLMLAAIAALVRFTRQAQRLAEIQMDFVAGVSHELRTPLTVIRTAAYNLRGRMANNPAQVERYGALIQQEGEKLTALVEQVLRFVSAKAGRVIREREPLSVEAVIEDGVESSKVALEQSRCVVERTIEPGLP
ncbi:MAG: hypothetical protein HYR60_28000, partial [Acidobacteria bacterium]|nr:hypothetical protein [Acidobacteriota bacterium]